jgi:DNA-binding transcriptional regulator YiaG
VLTFYTVPCKLREMAKRQRKAAWDAAQVQHLRSHLRLTQQQLAEELGTRQQTISEWETGQYQPRGASARLLTLVAERAGFLYQTAGQSEEGRQKEEEGE